ncbi:UNVERIFIED_CONTAM: hypothetical protein GTU68_062577, partial [Idotea baltica]|nr:hypothetical protein [Idotea baltica]
RVIESKNKEYPVGTYVLGYLGWRTLTHISQERLQLPDVSSALWKLVDLGEIPRAAALGILGMPGNTAYFGLLEVCKPKPGETVLVNAAAGAVGSLVCQIAKLVGCTVIGFAGTDEKVAWLKELGIDHAFNYKTNDVSQSLKLAAPGGIDCFFDNVGGRFAADALPHMTMFGRVAICGCISALNLEGVDLSSPSLTSPYSAYFLITKQLKVEGFLVSRWADRWTEGIFQMKEWLLQG